jgi:mannose-1-phosphate guanylyltransferase
MLPRSEELQALILVGGEATRLRPLTLNVPKAMVPVLNLPFLQHVISYLKGHGIAEVVLAQGHLSRPMIDYFQDGSRFGARLVHALESQPLGTGGAIKNAENYLHGRFVVLNGDIFTDLDLTAMLKFHDQRQAAATIALTPVADPTAYGLIETDKDGRVTRFLEKPKPEQVTTNMINAGTLVLEERLLQDIPANTKYSYERELFPKLLERGERIFAYPSGAYWIDIGTPDKYLQLHKDLLTGKCQSALPYQSENVFLGRRCEVDSSARLIGPLVLGDDCRIGPDALLEGPLALGSRVNVSARTQISGSVVWNSVSFGLDASIRNCLIADGCCLGNAVSLDGSVLGAGIDLASHTVLGASSRIWPADGSG